MLDVGGEGLVLGEPLSALLSAAGQKAITLP